MLEGIVVLPTKAFGKQGSVVGGMPTVVAKVRATLEIVGRLRDNACQGLGMVIMQTASKLDKNWQSYQRKHLS